MLFGTISPLQVIWLEQLTLEKHTNPISAITGYLQIWICTVKSLDKVRISGDAQVPIWSQNECQFHKKSIFEEIKSQCASKTVGLIHFLVTLNFLMFLISNCARPTQSKFTIIFSRQNFLVKSQHVNYARHKQEVMRYFSSQIFPVKKHGRFFTKVNNFDTKMKDYIYDKRLWLKWNMEQLISELWTRINARTDDL